MNSDDLFCFRKWFTDYCRSYYRADDGEQMNISLKEKHSRNVAENASLIAAGESLGEGDQLLAETIGLFHDVGRFPQYAKYKTFSDADSVNHGVLGAATLTEHGILERLPANERELILAAVRYHNAFAVPATEDERAGLFIRLVRDADKLDIWRVFASYYEGGEEAGAKAVPLGLPDLPGCSREALSSLMRREIVKLGQVKTLTDLKLLQLSCVFDMNFSTSFLLAENRNSINRLAAQLPRMKDIMSALQIVRDHVIERLPIR